MTYRVDVLAAALTCSLSAVASAQMAVTDPALTTATSTGLAQNAARLAEQTLEVRKQLAQAQAQYQALTGSRQLGAIHNNPQYRDYLPGDWKRTYGEPRSAGGPAGLTSTDPRSPGAELCTASRKNPDPKRALEARKACEAATAKPAQDKDLAMEAYDKAKKRLEQIEALMRAINATQDAKAIAELQARIAGEQAAIQNEHTKLQMFQMAAQADGALREQNQRAIENRTWSSRKGIDAAPLTFK